MQRPSLSVVIPTYNRSPMLLRALRSVRAQTSLPDELIVVDDASTDDTERLIGATQDDKSLPITYLRHQVNRGNAAARNTGAAKANGDWICFLDSDDEYETAYCAQLRDAVRRDASRYGFYWTGITWVNQSERSGNASMRRELWDPNNDLLFALVARRRIGTNCGLAVRRSVFEDLGGFCERLRAAVDTEFLLRLAQRTLGRALRAHLVRVYRHRGSHVRRDLTALAAAYEYILTEQEALLKRWPTEYARYHYKAGWLQYAIGNRQRGRAHMRRALRTRATRWKAVSTTAMYEALGSSVGRWVHQRVSRAAASPRGG